MSDARDRSIIRELRRHRRDRRLGDIEWFDVAYRVYLFALGGTALVIWASDVADGLLDDVGEATLIARGPSLAGVVVALAVAVGLRHGAEGGPVSLESGDARHLLLAPVDRRLAMFQPTAQRIRSACFVPAVVLAVVGQLIGREVVGSRAAWAAAGALFGIVLGAITTSTAVLTHAARLPRSLVGWIAVALIGWQLATAAATWRADVDGTGPTVWEGAGPFDALGSVALWGIRQRWIDVAAVAVVALLVVAAFAAAGRLRLESLERRGQLVSQLRFAATTQDLRTVVQLRRQLGAEVIRPRSFGGFRAPVAGSGPVRRPLRRPHSDALPSRLATPPTGLVMRRGIASLVRFPTVRIVRLVVLSALGGAAARATLDWSPLAGIGVVLAAFVVALELLEPLAQEIDHPDRTDGLPADRGALFSLLLLAPASGLAACAVIGAAVATAIEPGDAAGAFGLAFPIAAAGAIGAVVTTVRDAPRPAAVRDTNVFGMDRTIDSPFSVPEFAGFGNVVSAIVPFALSSISIVPLIAIESSPEPGTIVRSAVGVALCLAVLVWWIRRRDRWAIAVRSFFEQGRAATASTGTSGVS